MGANLKRIARLRLLEFTILRTFTLAEVSRSVLTILSEVTTASICKGRFKFIGIALHLIEWVVLVALESIATV